MPPSDQPSLEQVVEEITAFAAEAAQGTPPAVLMKQFTARWEGKYGRLGRTLALSLFTIMRARGEEANDVRTKPKPTIAIITALPKEFAAVECLLETPNEFQKPGRGAGRRYTLGNIPATSGGSHLVVLAMLTEMGNNIAAVRATLLSEHFPEIEAIVMTGIAGGIPHSEKVEEHVRLGDIVVSNRNGVVQYDNLKSERKEDIAVDTVRAALRPPSAKMLEAVRYLEAQLLKGPPPWNPLTDRVCQFLKGARPSEEEDILHHSTRREEVVPHPPDTRRERGRPRLFHGPIAAANILLKDPIRRDKLREAHGAKAVEMEGSGIADATWIAGDGYLVVRGICDYCDMSKGDGWQAYAAAVAAAYTIALIASMPVVTA